jgi:hypothetical protein
LAYCPDILLLTIYFKFQVLCFFPCTWRPPPPHFLTVSIVPSAKSCASVLLYCVASCTCSSCSSIFPFFCFYATLLEILRTSFHYNKFDINIIYIW